MARARQAASQPRAARGVWQPSVRRATGTPMHAGRQTPSFAPARFPSAVPARLDAGRSSRALLVAVASQHATPQANAGRPPAGGRAGRWCGQTTHPRWHPSWPVRRTFRRNGLDKASAHCDGNNMQKQRRQSTGIFCFCWSTRDKSKCVNPGHKAWGRS